MKIEKISDTQIKFILTKEDLIDRDIKLDELSSPTDKTQNLFKEIMEQAMEECDFIADDAPLMVEAVPVALDGIMIIVTKLADKNLPENKLSLLSQSKEARKFKRKSITPYENKSQDEGEIVIYSFDSLDDIIHVALRLKDVYYGTNTVYKYMDKYFLVMQNDISVGKNKFSNFLPVLNEYGTKHISSVITKYYLIEHGELIVKNPAIHTLADHFDN